MMDLEINYKKLTVRELKILIAKDDPYAVKEHIRRIKAGEIMVKSYTPKELELMTKKAIKKK